MMSVSVGGWKWVNVIDDPQSTQKCPELENWNETMFVGSLLAGHICQLQFLIGRKQRNMQETPFQSSIKLHSKHMELLVCKACFSPTPKQRVNQKLIFMNYFVFFTVIRSHSILDIHFSIFIVFSPNITISS